MNVWFLALLSGAALAVWKRDAVVENITRAFYATTQDSRENERLWKPRIAHAEKQFGIPEGLLHRLIYQESRFRSDIITGAVRSPAGAVGIAQIVPRWHPDVDPLDPEDSIHYAARILKNWYKQFGSWKTALAAYNAGPGNVVKHKGIPPFEETQKYVAQITADIKVT